MKTLGPKDPEEVKILTFDFRPEAGDLAITSAVTVATVDSGEDPNADALISGAAVIVGQKVRQRVTGGLRGVVYKLRCKATDSEGGVHVITGRLLVQAL